jgi:hypothetical protein
MRRLTQSQYEKQDQRVTTRVTSWGFSCIAFLTVPIQAGSTQENTALSVLTGETLRDIQGPVSFPADARLFMSVFILALLVVVGIYIFYKFKPVPKKIETQPVDLRTPWEIAFDELNQLERGGLLEQGKFKEYYFFLADIIRRYFERRFDIRAPEMTTEEFLWSLEGSSDFSLDQRSALKNFLNSCDIVKFAKYVPRIAEAQESFVLAKQLIDETKEKSNIQSAATSRSDHLP